MASLEITKYPAPVLQQRSDEIPELTPEILELVPKMISAMLEHDGIGLAGPQISIPKRIIIVQDAKGSHPFINPKIASKSKKETVEEEGCLSLPGIFLPIKRAEEIEVLCQTPEGENIHIKAEGLLARIFQHEIDHLDGFLIIDRTSKLKRLKIRKELQSFKKHYESSNAGTR